MLTDTELAAIEDQYAPESVPDCPVCGVPMVHERAYTNVWRWNCRTHYLESAEWFKPVSPDGVVVRLVAEVRALRQEVEMLRDALYAEYVEMARQRIRDDAPMPTMKRAATNE